LDGKVDARRERRRQSGEETCPESPMVCARPLGREYVKRLAEHVHEACPDIGKDVCPAVPQRGSRQELCFVERPRDRRSLLEELLARREVAGFRLRPPE